MRKSFLTLTAFVAVLFASAPASANGFDPRMVGAIMQSMMQQHRRPLQPQMYAQRQPQRCGFAYIPNARGGTILTGLPDCGPYNTQNQARPWVAPSFNGGYQGQEGERESAHSFTSTRHLETEWKKRTVNVIGSNHTADGQQHSCCEDNVPEGFHVNHE